MEIYTMDRGFKRLDTLDNFESAIWTERYLGNNEFEFDFPASVDIVPKIPAGIFVGIEGSDQPGIVEDIVIENDILKVTGIGLVPWLNNRFLRYTPYHTDKTWYIPQSDGLTPGQVITTAVQNWAIASVFLTDPDYTVVGGVTTWNNPGMRMGNPSKFKIPGLYIKATDTSGTAQAFEIPYGPLYDALSQVAEAYGIGMKITLDSVTDVSYSIGFSSYSGKDRTSDQTTNPLIRFSPDTDSLIDIKELTSLDNYKTCGWIFSPDVDDTTTADHPVPESIRSPGEGTGFDMRAEMFFSEINESQIEDLPDVPGEDHPTSIMTNWANVTQAELDRNFIIPKKLVMYTDGQISPSSQYKYGTDYMLGDIVEIQGYSGALQNARVTEHIISQDPSGEKSYPTVEILGS